MRFYSYPMIIAALTAGSAVSAADAPPPDNVTCIGQALSLEDREIALVMFAESTENEPIEAEPALENEAVEEPPFQSEHMAEVFELLEEAHMRCLDLYPWNSGQSETSRLHAFLNIFGEAIARTLKLEEMDIAIIDTFYEINKKKLANRNRLTAPEKAALAAHLQMASWPMDDKGLLEFATDYAETLMMKEMLRRAFDTGDFSKLERL
jgi:hypothetical protein